MLDLGLPQVDKLIIFGLFLKNQFTLTTVTATLLRIINITFPKVGLTVINVFLLLYFQVSNKFAFSLFDLDWDVFSAHIEGACNRVPIIAETGVKSTVCGPESFTADHKPLMGEAPELRGFYHGCGFNSSGIMLAGGCGRELARWVAHGHPELDMYGYDIR